MAPFSLAIPLKHDSVTVSQNLNQVNGVEVSLFLIYCAFPTVACQNVSCEKGVFDYSEGICFLAMVHIIITEGQEENVSCCHCC